nr:MAG TPA: hypothetical protein [Caudoviricetes sp.]
MVGNVSSRIKLSWFSLLRYEAYKVCVSSEYILRTE